MHEDVLMDDSDYLPISGIQHFSFCRRQWALIHIERQWAENLLTAEGRLLHEHCHDESFNEKRRDLLITRGMRVVSHRLRLQGVCDVVEFHAVPDGVPINGHKGLWRPMPVEYKRGSSKEIDADRLQLCAQAMALEEMLVCDVPSGAIYYGRTHRRESVEFTPELRQMAQDMADEMNLYFARGYTPKVRTGKRCDSCSLNEACLPAINKRMDVEGYIRAHAEYGGREGDTV